MVNHYQEKSVEIQTTNKIENGNAEFTGNVRTSDKKNTNGNMVIQESYEEFKTPDELRKYLYNVYNRTYVIEDKTNNDKDKYKRNKSLITRLQEDFNTPKQLEKRKDTPYPTSFVKHTNSQYPIFLAKLPSKKHTKKKSKKRKHYSKTKSSQKKSSKTKSSQTKSSQTKSSQKKSSKKKSSKTKSSQKKSSHK